MKRERNLEKVEKVEKREVVDDEKIKVTNAHLEGILVSETVKKLMSNMDIPARLRYWLSVFVKEGARKIEPFLEEKEKLYKEYGDRYESDVFETKGETGEKNKIHSKGDLIIFPDGRGGGTYSIFKNKEIIDREIRKIATIEIVFSINRLKFDKGTVELLSGQDMLVVSNFADLEVDI